MLCELRLANFAIIDSVTVGFGKGLNIITGETGTGKSIIIDAVNIILGDKFSSEFIRYPDKESCVEALFKISGNDSLKARLEESGIDLTDNDLIVKRTANTNGRNKIYVNNSFCNLATLQNLTEGLVDVYGQHQHQELLKKNSHISYLDTFAQLDSELFDYSANFRKLTALNKKYRELKAGETDKNDRREFLKFQLKEIEAADLKEGEEEELEREKSMLDNSEELSTSFDDSFSLLYESDGSAISRLKNSIYSLESVAKLDSRIEELKNRLETVLIETEDISYTIRDLNENVNHNPARLEEIVTRLNDIKKLKKKHGFTVEEILSKQKKLKDELNSFENIDETLDKLDKQIKELLDNTEKLAGEISLKRKKASKALEKIFSDEAETVGLKGAYLKTDFQIKELSADGKDKVAFLFSANPDQAPKPLDRVASGGELSRIMLILKGFVSGNESGSVLIFDEADTGIGGAVADVIGRKIKKLSAGNQVLCITHLPQVARYADTHLLVKKSFENKRTDVEIESLDQNGRVEELSRMLAGEKVSRNTIQVAKELISGAVKQ